ncbi:hypothetical protein Tco_0918197 [Tanacetum coccineum]
MSACSSIYMMFTSVNAAGSSCDSLGGSISVNVATLPNADLPTDPLMPGLEDTTNLLNTGSKLHYSDYAGASLDRKSTTGVLESLTPEALIEGREQTPLFPSMLAIQAEEGKGLGHPSEPQPPPSTAQPIHEEPIPNIVSLAHQKTQTPRQALNQVTEFPQTSEPIPNVPDEAVYEEWDNRVERAATTAASLDAAQASGNITKTQSTTIPNVPLPRGIGTGGSPRCQETTRGSIAQTRSERVPTSPYDSPLPRVNTLESDEGITLVTPTHSQEDQPEDQLEVFSAAKVLADAAKNVHTYTRRRREVSTGSGGVSTAEESVSIVGASMPVSTAGMVQEVNKDKAMRLQEQLDEEERQRIARMHEDAKSFNIEEWENIKATIEADEELAQRIQAKEREKYFEAEKARLLAELIKQRKRYFS